MTEGGAGSVRIPAMEGSRPTEFAIDVSDAISAPEAFGASFDAAPLSGGARAR